MLRKAVYLSLVLFSAVSSTTAGTITIDQPGVSYLVGTGDNVITNSRYSGGLVIGDGTKETTNLVYRFYLPPPTVGTNSINSIKIHVYGFGWNGGLTSLTFGKDPINYEADVPDGDYQTTWTITGVNAQAMVSNTLDGIGYVLDIRMALSGWLNKYDLSKVIVECTYDNVDQRVLDNYMGVYSAFRIMADYRDQRTNLWARQLDVETIILKEYRQQVSDAIPGWKDIAELILDGQPLGYAMQLWGISDLEESLFNKLGTWLFVDADNGMFDFSRSINYNGGAERVLSSCDAAKSSLSALAITWKAAFDGATAPESVALISGISTTVSALDALKTKLQSEAGFLDSLYQQRGSGSPGTSTVGDRKAQVLLSAMAPIMSYDYAIGVPGPPLNEGHSLLPRVISSISAQQADFVSVTIQASPAGQGLQIKVDGTTYTDSADFIWLSGTPHTIESVPQGGYAFAGWSDGGLPSHTITPESDGQYVATYVQGQAVALPSVADTMVGQYYTNMVAGAWDFMDVANFWTNNRAYVRFDLSSMPTGSTINSVELRLYVSNYYNPDNGNVCLSALASTWTENTTWNARPTFSTSFIGFSDPGAADVTWSWTSSSFGGLKDVVQDWVNGVTANYGFVLLATNLVSATRGGGSIAVRTKEWSTDSQRPKLIINYTPPPTGTMTVSLYPAAARTAGAKWKLVKSGYDSGWQTHGFVVSDLGLGSYTLSFKSIAGWLTPDSRTVTIASGGNTNSGTYGFNVQPPTGVNATDNEYSDRVRVTWTAATGATKYEVWRGTSDDPAMAGKLLDSISSVSFDDFSATPGNTYYYWVCAGNSAGMSDKGGGDSGVRLPYTYTVNGGAVTITHYGGIGGDVIIPDSISGMAVVGIGINAFSGCAALTGITIPSSVTNIEESAFADCTNLVSVTVSDYRCTITNGTVTISEYTGAGGGVSIPGTIVGLPVTCIGVFSCWDSGITSVIFPESVTCIGDGAFQTCRSLTNVILPPKVTDIGPWAFVGCANLTNVTIPTSVTNIGEQAFALTGLTNIVIPSSVRNLNHQYNPFFGCRNLTTITVDPLNPAYSSEDGVLFDKVGPSLICYGRGRAGPYTVLPTVSSVGWNAFSGCYGLTSITISNGIRNIDGHAFESCTNLLAVVIPDSVTNIGMMAFSYCYGVTNVTIGRGVASMDTGNVPFRRCRSLTGFIVDKANPAYESIEGVLFDKRQNWLIQYPPAKRGAWYTVPSNVTGLGRDAFLNCFNLTAVTIPSDVTLIDRGAMSECTNLARVFAFGNAPELDSTYPEWTFAGTPATIYHVVGTTGWTDPWAGRPVALWDPVSGFGYSTNNGEATILTHFGTNEMLAIPEAFDGVPVAGIGSGAFGGSTGLTSVVLHAGISNIGDGAFSNCAKLGRAYFRGNAPMIGAGGLGDTDATVYYLPGTTGWGDTFDGRPTALWRSRIADDDRFGVLSNRFGFTVNWASGMVTVIEACTDPVSSNWVPLQTNTLLDDSVLFEDPAWTNYPARFYRISTP